MPLVVVHDDDDVVPAADGLREYRVGRRRLLLRDVDALGESLVDCGLYLFYLFTAEHAVLAAVRVETRDAYFRLADAERLAALVCDADDLEHARLLDAVAGLAQRDVRRNVDDAQLLVR